ncbi:MAG: endolytic transglycosylase MltG [Paludibacteraceae bacterium]|nr:endolytic transglycosylase MltG [Paludibacteraceae bacterium]
MIAFIKKMTVVVIVVLLLIGLISGVLVWWVALRNNVRQGDSYTLFVRPFDDMEDVLDRLEDDNILLSSSSIESLVVLLHHYDGCEIRPGRYILKPGMRNIDIVRKLRHGWQEPVRLVINSMRLPENFAASVGRQLMYDSAAVMAFISDSAQMNALGLTYENLFANIVENTYEVWWTEKPSELFARLVNENGKYWAKNDRLGRAERLGLTPEQICIVASIVDCESHYKPELPTIAGLYINRLKKDMLLQSDPTVKFALKDFAKKRILNADLKCNSPYNTYIYKGLPPGPICLPNQSTIEAVLNAENTHYIYMCADASLNGTHRFAVTEAEHARNAAAYHKAIRGLR